MLPETVREWIERGIEQGGAEECALLCRLAARKFDAAAGRQFWPPRLAEVTDPGLLAQAAERSRIVSAASRGDCGRPARRIAARARVRPTGRAAGRRSGAQRADPSSRPLPCRRTCAGVSKRRSPTRRATISWPAWARRGQNGILGHHSPGSARLRPPARCPPLLDPYWILMSGRDCDLHRT